MDSQIKSALRKKTLYACKSFDIHGQEMYFAENNAHDQTK